MKHLTSILFAAVLLVSGSTVASAQVDKQIASIRSKTAAINKNAAKYKKTQRDITEASTEGGEATYFHDGNVLKKITAKIYGETYNAVVELYFDGGDPMFYFFRLNKYDTQIGLEKPVKVVRSEERRFYFADTKLVKLMVGHTVINERSKRHPALLSEITSLAEMLRLAYSEMT